MNGAYIAIFCSLVAVYCSLVAVFAVFVVKRRGAK
jgi:hypothetical protein